MKKDKPNMNNVLTIEEMKKQVAEAEQKELAERAQAFSKELQALSAKYGYKVEAQVIGVPVPDWKPAEQTS